MVQVIIIRQVNHVVRFSMFFYVEKTTQPNIGSLPHLQVTNLKCPNLNLGMISHWTWDSFFSLLGEKDRQENTAGLKGEKLQWFWEHV